MLSFATVVMRKIQRQFWRGWTTQTLKALIGLIFFRKEKNETVDWLIDWLLIICFVALQVTYIILKNIEKDIFYYI